MAKRYIDADALLTDEMTHTLPNGCGRSSGRVVVFVEDIDNIPTADVVPRAEVDEIAEELSDTIVEKDQLFDMVVKQRATIEQIFAEIEEYMLDSQDNLTLTIYKSIGAATFAELKKKYIGEQNDDN